MERASKEIHNQKQFDLYAELGPVRLGPYTSYIWRTDPKHLQFLLSRYLFVSKMLAGKSEALEVGCGDALGTPIVLQTVKKVYALDFEPIVIDAARHCIDPTLNCEFVVQDITEAPFAKKVDAVYSLDCIEHIPPEKSERYFANVAASINNDGIAIIGTPNITANAYASEGSRTCHVNLQSHETLRAALAAHFKNVFIYSMNDGLVHTGFYPMAHYLLGVGVGKKI
ncbi:class I SAM-dependent methyltransferase [Patescibacteria group bacterium]|nr:MAG: class I SAM-dependent methyltransferase [Patescibacteria group bacterium]